MTKTITVLTASALALITNAASAFDFYNGFTNQETVPNVQSEPRRQPMAATWTSLDALQAGNPDSSVRPFHGGVMAMEPTAARINSLDTFTAGNPDSTVHPVRDQGRSQSDSAMAMSSAQLAGSRI